MMKAKYWALAPLVVVMGGCTALHQMENDIDATTDKTASLVKEVGRTAPGAVMPSTPLVTHDSGIWLGKNVVKLGQPALPPIFYEPTTFDRTLYSLSELAERITLRTGIPSRVTADTQEVAGMAFRNRPGAAGFNATQPLPPGLPGENGPGAAPGAAAGNAARLPLPSAPTPQLLSLPADASTGVRISYANGSLKGLLDTAAARFGVSWKYVDGTIQFFHTESRNFQINAIPGDSTFTATVTSGATSTGGVSGGGSSGGGSTTSSGSAVSANNSQNTGVASKLSVYSGIENAIKVMLSPYGKVLASPATGAITVVDTPDSLDKIAAYIDGENKALSRQIAINVTVLSVSLSHSDEYGINWSAVYNSLNRNFGISNSFTPASPGSGNFTAGIVGSSKFSGTTAVINALSEQGKVRRQTTASVVTLNNQPVPVQVARQTSYLQSSQTSIVAQVGTTTTLIPGVVTAGFNMSILPHVLTNGTVMLQFSTDISTLRGIRQIESNGSRIESPELDTRNFLQRVAMKSNETLIISGFEQTDDNLDFKGVGTPRNFLLGGGVNGQNNKEIIVVLITPVAMAAI
ncbi:PilN family type IVB pilus formation outer membrane protein [Herbaspirillum sp. DW155]|uniref:PilN family type IVB pilus formation outer membrane protein n=2 Tax=Herbaspirillum sp. DW155 TaxID=3095609 RepID=UPI0030856582|nr:PilN family type IVB pilus formation outer membrane protein [Herbaspirillum sp. DW155]